MKRIAMVLMAVAIMTAMVTTNVYAQGKVGAFPAYGREPIEVQIYTDYFCPSCSAMKSSVDPLLKELVNTA